MNTNFSLRVVVGCFLLLATTHLSTASGLKLYGRSFDLNYQREVRELRAFVSEKVALSLAQSEAFTEHRRQLTRDRALHDLDDKDIRSFHHPPRDTIGKKERRGLNAIEPRLDLLMGTEDSQIASKLRREILELAAAVENNRRHPFPNAGTSSVFTGLGQLRNPVGGGSREAQNALDHECAARACAPENSSFWTRPDSIPTQDLYAGFGRRILPDWTGLTWHYHKPKTGRGANAGFEVRSGLQTAKIKFAETHSEPFTTRVFHTLGYNVDVTDHAPYIRLRYDRRIFLEFNVRAELSLNIRFFGLFNLARVNMQAVHDPFEYVAGVELKSGEFVPGHLLRNHLLHDPEVAASELQSSDFDQSFETRIEFVVTKPVSVQPDDPTDKSVGPWAYDELDHAQLREVRAAGLLAAWCGWFDARFDNTRLRLVDGELKHFFSDLGSGLGRADAAFNWLAESVNDFPWTFTEAPIVRGKGRMTTPFRVVNFHTVMDNAAFKAMTENDARWMAELIGSLTRGQIVDALLASGYDAAETVLYAEKLIHRRNTLLAHLGLDGDHAMLNRRFDTTEFDYAPEDDPYWLSTRTRKVLNPRPFGSRVVQGSWVPDECQSPGSKFE